MEVKIEMTKDEGIEIIEKHLGLQFPGKKIEGSMDYNDFKFTVMDEVVPETVPEPEVPVEDKVPF